MAKHFPAIVLAALESEARLEHLEDAVHAELKQFARAWSQGAKEDARHRVGEEIWRWMEVEYGGHKNILSSRDDLVDTGIMKNLTRHLRQVFEYPDASLLEKTQATSEDDVVDGKAVAMIFVEEWARKGLVPPVAEVRGLFIKRSVARDVIVKVYRDAEENNYLPSVSDAPDKARTDLHRLHRIVLQRLEKAQVVVSRLRYYSPLSTYCKMQPSQTLDPSSGVIGKLFQFPDDENGDAR